MALAKTIMESSGRPDYWRGFQLGLQRRFYGEQFGTDLQHKIRMESIHSSSLDQLDAGCGYHDGFEEREPEI
jgi:hypothetical protein